MPASHTFQTPVVRELPHRLTESPALSVAEWRRRVEAIRAMDAQRRATVEKRCK